MSYSWVDPHTVSLFARREEARMTARLAARLQELAPDDESLPGVVWGHAAWSAAFEDERLLGAVELRRQL
ncbi:MAG: hypothetical protein HY511_08800 [Actinobacteria bacterium]|nr:hypothetical protein [Actinomycetota bacterium]